MRTIDWEHLVDTLLCIDVCSIATVGFIESIAISARNASGSSVVFMGLQQHQWSTLHTFLSYLLLVLVVFHIFFNSSLKIDSTTNYFGNQRRRTLFVITGAWLGVLVLAWLTLKL